MPGMKYARSHKEGQKPGKSTARMSAPAQPASLNHEFLEMILMRGIVSYVLQSVSTEGKGFMANLYRVKVITQDEDTISLVFKFMLDPLKEFSHLREVHVYTQVLPLIHPMLRKVWPEMVPCAPAHIFSNNKLLVLEDLDLIGYKMAEVEEGLDLDHCLLLLRVLARYHAASAIIHSQDPAIMKFCHKSVFEEPEIQKSVTKFVSAMLHSLASEIQKWSDSVSIYADKVHRLADKLVTKINDAAKCKIGKFNVLNHCDLWINNMMFKQESNQVDSVKLVDFQMAQFSTPGLDLNHFIYTSPSEQVRTEHTEHLLQEYHKILTESLSLLGYSGHIINMEELMVEFDDSVAYGVFAACIDLPIMRFKGKFDLDAAFLEGEIPEEHLFSSSSYRQTLERLLPIFESKGIFD